MFCISDFNKKKICWNVNKTIVENEFIYCLNYHYKERITQKLNGRIANTSPPPPHFNTTVPKLKRKHTSNTPHHISKPLQPTATLYCSILIPTTTNGVNNMCIVN